MSPALAASTAVAARARSELGDEWRQGLRAARVTNHHRKPAGHGKSRDLAPDVSRAESPMVVIIRILPAPPLLATSYRKRIERRVDASFQRLASAAGAQPT